MSFHSTPDSKKNDPENKAVVGFKCVVTDSLPQRLRSP
jgi:hypothetical protein